MKKVYVAGALNADAVGYIKNCHNMIKQAIEIQRLGFAVFVPCLDFLQGLVAGNYEYQDYFNNSQPWLEASDIVYVLPNSHASKGTQKEILRAEELHISVVYCMFELIKYADNLPEGGSDALYLIGG
jgi:hypothetical protein